eukprot:m.183784 g.183784  ORF g.183784 m.183784 type:complete len:917 (-) comp14698_c0_seq1:354-3104(-)
MEGATTTSSEAVDASQAAVNSSSANPSDLTESGQQQEKQDVQEQEQQEEVKGEAEGETQPSKQDETKPETETSAVTDQKEQTSESAKNDTSEPAVPSTVANATDTATDSTGSDKQEQSAAQTAEAQQVETEAETKDTKQEQTQTKETTAAPTATAATETATSETATATASETATKASESQMQASAGGTSVDTEASAANLEPGVDFRTVSQLPSNLVQLLTHVVDSGYMEYDTIPESTLNKLCDMLVIDAENGLKRFTKLVPSYAGNREYVLFVLDDAIAKAKTIRLSPFGPEREERIQDLLFSTGYPLTVEFQERIFGPPPNLASQPRPSNSEVFLGHLPFDSYEDELVPLLQHYGTIYQLKLVMAKEEPTKNRGFALVTYTEPEAAKECITALNNYEIRTGWRIGTRPSYTDTRLFVGGCDRRTTNKQLQEQLSQYVGGVTEVIMYRGFGPHEANRGFAFVEFSDHGEASKALKDIKANRIPYVTYADWAKPENVETGDNDNSTVYVSGITRATTRDTITPLFEVYGKVVKATCIRDYAFVKFETHEAAVKAREGMNGKQIDGNTVKCTWAKPEAETDKKRRPYSGYPHSRSFSPPRFGRGRGRGRGRGSSRGSYPPHHDHGHYGGPPDYYGDRRGRGQGRYDDVQDRRRDHHYGSQGPAYDYDRSADYGYSASSAAPARDYYGDRGQAGQYRDPYPAARPRDAGASHYDRQQPPAQYGQASSYNSRDPYGTPSSQYNDAPYNPQDSYSRGNDRSSYYSDAPPPAKAPYVPPSEYQSRRDPRAEYGQPPQQQQPHYSARSDPYDPQPAGYDAGYSQRSYSAQAQSQPPPPAHQQSYAGYSDPRAADPRAEQQPYPDPAYAAPRADPRAAAPAQYPPSDAYDPAQVQPMAASQPPSSDPRQQRTYSSQYHPPAPYH